MNDIDIKNLAKGELDAVQEKLWNSQGTWPDNFDDENQNPHERPINYWVPTVGGQRIGWEGVSGWATKEKALQAARKFRDKCIEHI